MLGFFFINIYTNSELNIGITAHGLSKAIGEYLQSERAVDVLGNLLQGNSETVGEDESVQPARSLAIRSRTARRWLHRLGFQWKSARKGVFVDGHERADVVSYRQNWFIPEFEKLRPLLVWWDNDGNIQIPIVPEGERPHVLIMHDESTFNANDGKRFLWVEDNKQPLRPKGRGKGIMVSDFLTAGGQLQVPPTISDELLESEGLPRRFASEYLEYSKDNYWTGEKMVIHTIKVALPIFRAAFPDFVGVWAFDNASNHCVFHENALRVDRLNKAPGNNQ